MRVSASVNGTTTTSEGVKLTQGVGNLSKVVLTSPHGRSVIIQYPLTSFIPVNYVLLFHLSIEEMLFHLW